MVSNYFSKSTHAGLQRKIKTLDIHMHFCGFLITFSFLCNFVGEEREDKQKGVEIEEMNSPGGT